MRRCDRRGRYQDYGQHRSIRFRRSRTRRGRFAHRGDRGDEGRGERPRQDLLTCERPCRVRPRLPPRYRSGNRRARRREVWRHRLRERPHAGLGRTTACLSIARALRRSCRRLERRASLRGGRSPLGRRARYRYLHHDRRGNRRRRRRYRAWPHRARQARFRGRGGAYGLLCRHGDSLRLRRKRASGKRRRR